MKEKPCTASCCQVKRLQSRFASRVAFAVNRFVVLFFFFVSTDLHSNYNVLVKKDNNNNPVVLNQLLTINNVDTNVKVDMSLLPNLLLDLTDCLTD